MDGQAAGYPVAVNGGCGAVQCGACMGCQTDCHPACSTCCPAVKLRKRICNATADSSFDVSMFIQNSTYYDGCDCVIFMNCTNHTEVVPANTTVTPSVPIPPIPPVPSGGSQCNYTCDEIRQLHIIIQNLTDIVADQQNDIDMLVGKYQELANKTSTNNCCSKVDAMNQEITDLYNIVNNITVSSTQDTLKTIQRDGVRLGNNWWLGEQDKYLFAIDVTDSTWYRFDPMVNRTL
jgi:hypothetical protein